jgi:hypothetical protein
VCTWSAEMYFDPYTSSELPLGFHPGRNATVLEAQPTPARLGPLSQDPDIRCDAGTCGVAEFLAGRV